MKRYGQPIFIWYKRQSFNVRGICYQHVGCNRVLLSGTRLKKPFPKHTRQQQMNGFIAITPSAVYSLWSNPHISYRNNIQSKHLRRKSWFPWPIAAIFDNLIKCNALPLYLVYNTAVQEVSLKEVKIHHERQDIY